jgi:hypothetical protein
LSKFSKESSFSLFNKIVAYLFKHGIDKGLPQAIASLTNSFLLGSAKHSKIEWVTLPSLEPVFPEEGRPQLYFR